MPASPPPAPPLLDIAAVRARLARRFGPDADPWCEALPALVRNLAGRWDLTLAPAWSHGGTSVVFPGVSGSGEPLVLKLTPEPDIAAQEAAALAAWRGSPHTVTLHDADLARGALLLERIRPGTRLADEPDQYPVEEIAPLLAAVRVPDPDPGLPSLGERAGFLLSLTRQRLGRDPDAAARIPPGVLDASRDLARELAGDGPTELVHGDLHPGNVLRGGPGRGLVTIDPRPCRGDPAFDAIDWSLADGGTERDVRRRIARLASRADHLDPDRAWSWCQAMAVVLAVIALTARHDPKAAEQFLALAPGFR